MSASVDVVVDERVAEVSADVIAALHEVLERHQVTEEEWRAALGFLTEVGRHDEFVLLSDVTRTSVLIDAISHGAEADATASDVEGPLYREDPPWREPPVKIYDDFEGIPDDPYLDNDTIGAVKGALVRPLIRHGDGASRGLDRQFFACEFDVKLRPAPQA